MYVLAQQPATESRSDQFITDKEGFLLNAEDWDISFSEELLRNDLIQLSSQHIKVIYFVREKVLHLSGLPPVRLICRSTGLEKIELIRLFGSCINLWRAAGLPKPDDEIRSHMN